MVMFNFLKPNMNKPGLFGWRGDVFLPYLYIRPSYTILVTPLGSYRIQASAVVILLTIVVASAGACFLLWRVCCPRLRCCICCCKSRTRRRKNLKDKYKDSMANNLTPSRSSENYRDSQLNGKPKYRETTLEESAVSSSDSSDSSSEESDTSAGDSSLSSSLTESSSSEDDEET